MASSNIKLFDENKGNMLSDSEFSISNQRMNGLQTGVASSKLQNKAMYQASLIAYAIAQVMMQNGKNANDTDAVSAFVANLSGTMLQKVYDIATTAEAQAGVATGKWMSPALVKAAIDTLAAKASNILSDTTKAMYGLGTDAVPDDVFAWLGKYNQYWWKKRVYVETSGYEEKRTDATTTVNLLYANDNTTTNTISYSDSISINQSTGTVSLKNPSTVTLRYNKYSESELINLFAGKYIKGAKDSPLTIYLVGAKIGQKPLATNGNLLQNFDSDSETGRYICITYPALKVITSQQVTTPTIGDWSYLQSSNRNAYPDSGITDGYEYQYLGTPFKNAADPPIEIEVVEYTGTGTNKTVSITFKNTPRAVFILPNNNSNSYICWWIFNSTQFCSTYTTGGYTASFDVSTNTLSWSGKTYAERWGNDSGTKHIAIAIL